MILEICLVASKAGTFFFSQTKVSSIWSRNRNVRSSTLSAATITKPLEEIIDSKVCKGGYVVVGKEEGKKHTFHGCVSNMPSGEFFDPRTTTHLFFWPPGV
jgi:hypothetical protein